MKKWINYNLILVAIVFFMFVSGCSSNKEAANEATEEIKETIQESNPSLTTIDFFSALMQSSDMQKFTVYCKKGKYDMLSYKAII